MAKVLIVIARLNVGGTSRYIEELFKGLTREGHEVLVATGFVQGSEREDSVVSRIEIVRVKSLGRKISLVKDIRSLLELKRIIGDFDPDLIYTHTFKAGALVRILKPKSPIIHAYHGHLIEEPELSGFRIRIVMAIERKLANRARILVTVGEKVGKELLQAGVGRSEQYLSIPPGVHPLKLIEKVKAREILGIGGDSRVIVGWLARVETVKGPRRVLQLAQEFPEVIFLLSGGGGLVDEMKIEAPENLKVLGWQSPEVVWSACDIAISTSDNEGMPVALIEAQLAGLPIVALDAGAISEVISDGESGYVFNNLNRDYFEALRRLIQNEKLRRKMGEAGRIRAMKLFNPENLIRDHLEAIERLQP